MIKYIYLSSFLEDVLIDIAHEEQKKENIKEYYYRVRKNKYISIPFEEIKQLQQKDFKLQRATLLQINCINFSQEQYNEIEREFLDYRNSLLDKYLQNINYSSYIFDYNQEKLFYQV